jgi:hypothetical protein
MRRKKGAADCVFTTAQQRIPQERDDVTKSDMKAGWGGSVRLHVFSENTRRITFNTLVRLRVTGCTSWLYISTLQEPPVGHRTVPTVGGSVCMEWNDVFVTGELGQERCRRFVTDTKCHILHRIRVVDISYQCKVRHLWRTKPNLILAKITLSRCLKLGIVSWIMWNIAWTSLNFVDQI